MAEKQQFKDRLLSLQGNLFNFACQLTANREAAQDLVQDTTLKVLDNEEKYVDNVNFKGWVFTIMRNIFINNYRKVFIISIFRRNPDFPHRKAHMPPRRSRWP